MYEGIVQDLIDELGRLPGIGPKSAQRIAFHILTMEETDIKRLAEILSVIKERVTYCEICGTVSEEPKCRICTDPRRDATMICVVEEPKDVVAVERSREFNGRYHVLGGALNPGRDIGPSSLRIPQLMKRLQDPGITEVIIATDPDSEGEATATYLARQLAQMGITVSRIATGVQMGGDLEYADEVTLGRAIAGRRNLNS